MKFTKQQLKKIVKEAIVEQDNRAAAVKRAARRAPSDYLDDESLTPQQKKFRADYDRMLDAPSLPGETSDMQIEPGFAPGPYSGKRRVSQADIEDMKDAGYPQKAIERMVRKGIDAEDRAYIKKTARDKRARLQGKIAPIGGEMDREGAIESADEADPEGQFQALARMAAGDPEDDATQYALYYLRDKAAESPYAQSMLDAVMKIQRRRAAKRERGDMSPAEFQALGGSASLEDEDDIEGLLEESKPNTKTKLTKAQIKSLIKQTILLEFLEKKDLS